MIDFTREADIVGPQLNGATFVHGNVAVELTEVEAYLGQRDSASHAFRGPTPRCLPMFGEPLHLYVYASYGIHRAGNIVCGPAGIASGVLLRSGRVVAGHEEVRRRRGDKTTEAGFARGPGNLGQALGFDLHLNGDVIIPRANWDEVDPECADFQLVMPTGQRPPVVAGRRIGISKNIDAPLRFWVPNDPTVTSPKRAPQSV